MKTNKPYPLKAVAFHKPATNQPNANAYTENPALIPGDNYLDRQDMLQLLKISVRTLQRWRKKNLLVFTKFEGKIIYSERALREMMEKRFRGE